MPKIMTFLAYSNQAEEAAKLYCSIFKNSKITKVTRCPEGFPMPKGTVMVVEFTLDGQEYAAMNAGDNDSFKFNWAVSLSIACKDQKEVDEYTEKLVADGGKQSQCGWVVDKFGLSWQVTPTILSELMGDKDPQKSKRVMEAMLKMKKLDIEKLKKAHAGN